MAVTFPTSPTNGQTFTANGLSYVYNATYGVWRLNVSAGGGGAGGGGTTTYATAAELPQTATNGDLALVEETDKLYIWNDTAWYNIALINTAPSITQGGAGSYTLATDGTPTVITLTATDPEELPITWTYSVTSGSLTNGGGVTATVTQADNVFTITPTTTEAYAGTFTLTFSVTDGANIVNDVNSFSLVFSTVVEDSRYTSFLLQSDVSLLDNQVDTSTSAHTINETGGVTSTALSPYHPSGYSTNFDGSGDYLTLVGGSPSFGYGSGDFTVEGWFYWNNWHPTNYSMMFMSYDSGSVYFSLQMDAGFLRLRSNNTGINVTDTGTWNTNQWYHVALTREGSVYRVFQDGTEVLNTDTTYAVGNYANLAIGGWSVADRSTDGYIRDFRVIIGSALYTTAFTPPTERLTAVDGTEVLTCHKAYIADGSTNNHAITIGGNTKTEQFVPFDYDKYDSTVHGGSVYFDGNGDTMSIPTSIGLNFMSNTDFTIECWIYKTGSFKNYDSIWSKYDTGGDGSGPWLHINNSGNILFGTTGLNGQTSTQAIKLNTWHHIAVVRDNPTIKVYLDGVATSISLTQSNSIGANVHPFLIGNINTYSRYFEGYMSDLRINNGTAVYTTDFTLPDEPLTAISGTTLLTCTNKNSIWDAAGGAALINIGDPTASTTQYKWSNSLYVDGVDDSVYFTIPNLLQTMGRTGTECTIEAWVYMVSAPASGTYVTAIYSVGAQGSTGGTNVISLEIQENQTVRALVNGAYSSLTGCPVSTGTVSTGQWTHLALVLYNQTWTIYINGTADGTGTGSYPSGTTHNAAYIGRSFYAANRTTEMYIEDLRISPRHARYTANFTPPTASLDG
jgi:hypothetical protein